MAILNLPRQSVYDILADHLHQVQGGIQFPKFESKRVGHCGRRSKLTQELRGMYNEIGQEYADNWMRLTDRLCQEELHVRGVDIARATIQRHFKLLKAKRVNLRIKPTLSEDHKVARMEYILDMANRDHGVLRHRHFFHDQLDTVHIDESWFYITTVDHSVMIWDAIAVPEAPTTRHKSHILKVMFLVAMGRPQRRPDGSWFDGKVGMWPCTEQVMAQRNSINRPAGTMETKPRFIDAEYYLELCTMDGGVLDCVKEKMAWRKHSGIIIQHDRASPHNGLGNTAALNVAGLAHGWHIRWRTQPAQSPDLNLLDLGFFHSLKSRVAKVKMGARTIDELIEKVGMAYEDYPWRTLEMIWAHQFAVWRVILLVDGDNQYPQPHEGARRRLNGGGEAVDLSIDVDEYNRVLDWLNDL